ncbi:MAG: DUF2752 domain-containing protein [Lachnospiraceae bacterium]|nr:DUF2752 domain-containing protein [Lachnospiraceae bacterium]
MKKYTALIVATGTLLIVGALVLTGIYRCPLRYFFGVPCPLCGMSRALYSLLTLDIEKAFYYHALWPVVVVGIPTAAILKIRKVDIKRYQINLICIILAVVVIGYYIYRHIQGSPVVQVNFGNSLIYRVYSHE